MSAATHLWNNARSRTFCNYKVFNLACRDISLSIKQAYSGLEMCSHRLCGPLKEWESERGHAGEQKSTDRINSLGLENAPLQVNNKWLFEVLGKDHSLQADTRRHEGFGRGLKQAGLWSWWKVTVLSWVAGKASFHFLFNNCVLCMWVSACVAKEMTKAAFRTNTEASNVWLSTQILLLEFW